MNTNYRLQICSHAEVFQTREAAMTYINRYFMPDNLLGEPTFYFYGDTESPNVILAVGLGDRKFATVDLGLTNENLEEISDSLGTDSENLNKAIATIKGIISSTGLTFDSNKVENQVSYEPDVKDELIGEADTLAEAVDLISKFVQNSVKPTNLIPEDSKSISMIYEPSADGMTLKSAIKISEYGYADENDDNNNIIGLKSDGIYATVNIEYDEDKNQLSFVTSGMKNGKFMDDANRKTINFGSHTQYTPDNEGYNVNLVVDKTRNTISANVKLSEDPNNILLIQDEKLFVDGRAANIKYKNGTVYSGINKLETSLEELKENVDTELETIKKHISDVEENTTIIGDTTDTMVITATKESNVGYKISGGVRLGDDKTIIHKDGGLEVDIEITCDAARNKLIVRTGNITKEVELPVVSLINDAYYDSTTQEIVISFDNGNHVRIPMGGLIITYTFENNTASPVVFQVNDRSRSTEKVVTTSFRLASNDNILSVNGNGELVAPKSAIDNAVAVETENRVAEDNKLSEAIQAEVQRATNAEQALTVSLNTEIERAKAAEQVNKDAISEVSKAVSDVNAKVEANTAAITLLNADDTTDGSVKYYAKYVYDELTKKVNDEQSRAEKAETDLLNRINVVDTKVDTSISSVLDEAKRYTDSSINTNNVQIGIDINAAKTEAIQTASEDATTKADSALTSAKAYTDDELTKNYVKVTDDIRVAKEEAIATASEDATTKSDKALSDAKAYTDAAVEKINTVEDSLSTSIDELKAKDVEIETSLAKKIEKVELVKNSQSDLQYILQVDGVPVSEINIPEDQFLKSVTYEEGSQTLVFVFKTSEGEITSNINISDLVDTYLAGNGLILEGNTFSVRKANLSESYLTVTADGVSINGIDAAIAQLNTTIQEKANEAQQNAISAAAEDATAKADKALEDAKVYTDNGLALKANSADVYTKEEINTKGYLTSADLSNYALKTDVVEETNRALAAEKINSDAIDVLEDRALAIENNVSVLQAEDRRLNLVGVDTASIKMNVSKQDTGTTVSANINLNTTTDNIIKLDTNGLYSSVDLSYNKAENKLSLIVNGKTSKEFELSDHSLVQEGHYDSSTQSIVLTIVKDGGETQQISIPIGDIINEWTVDNGTNNPISLSKTTGVDGVDVLKAELEISTEAHNAILNRNGTLYVSNRAQDMTALWGGDEITIQKAIENIKTETDKVAGVVSDVETLKSDMTQVKNDITVLKGDVDTLEVKVEQNTQNITQNTNSINTLTEQVTELETKVDSYENRITNIETNVQNIQNNINQITEDINSIKDEIGGEGGGESIISRLTKLEEQVNNLIDFGNFS